MLEDETSDAPFLGVLVRISTASLQLETFSEASSSVSISLFDFQRAGRPRIKLSSGESVIPCARPSAYSLSSLIEPSGDVVSHSSVY